jgi:cysteinyl-tRNA synthetase
MPNFFYLKIVTLFIFIVLTGCMFTTNSFSSDPTNNNSLKRWLYLLQNATPDVIIKSGYNIVVMDSSRDGSEHAKYVSSSIEAIKMASIIPLCYLSIGEAEDYRPYWRPEWRKTSEWLGEENLEWKGNYKVKYWHPDWQTIIFSYLDMIIEQGFSGVYLDIVDGFEYWNNEENPKHSLSEREAAEKMIAFIKALTIHARKKAGNNFKVFPQNGERLLDYDHDGSYLEIISGHAVEDIWYDGISPQPITEVNERISLLRKIIKSDKIVLAVEYIDDGSGYKGANKMRIDKFVSNCKKQGFYCYIANNDRELDSINRIQHIQP